MTNTVTWFSDKASDGLNEIYQQTGMVFSFLSAPKDGFKQCHQWVKCRDYLHDAVRTTITGVGSEIYGFYYTTENNPPVDLRRMRMLVSKNGLRNKEAIDNFKIKMRAGLALLNHFEKYSKIGLSTIKEVPADGSKKKIVFVFTGSQIWVKSPCLVSMYTYLIRLGDKELECNNVAALKKSMKATIKLDIDDNDIAYLKRMWDKLHIIMKERTKLFPVKEGVHDIYHMKHSIQAFHNTGGILSLIDARTPDMELNKRVRKLIHKK